MNFDFRITAIFAYWFDIEITYKNQIEIITSSLYLNNDEPKILLRNLYECLWNKIKNVDFVGTMNQVLIFGV